MDRPLLQEDGHVDVRADPGLGIDLDWDRLGSHPYERAHLLRLFSPGWELRSSKVEGAEPPAEVVTASVESADGHGGADGVPETGDG